MSIFAAIALVITAIYVANISLKKQYNDSAKASTGTIYYVATTGNDANAGTLANPFKTVGYGVRVLQPGDELKIFGGTYNEKIIIASQGTDISNINISSAGPEKVIIDGVNKAIPTIDITGKYINISNLEIKNGPHTCVKVRGTNIRVDTLIVNNCIGHGIEVLGQHVIITNNTIYNTVRENVDRNLSSLWGSALKTYIGADDVTFSNNTAYNNYGEGIATTRGKNIVIKNNFFYDNYSVNLYIDNSYNVKAYNNLVTCTGNSEFFRNGAKAAGIALAEEYYENWGAQLANIEIYNNLVGFCKYGIADYGSDVAGGGLDNVKIYNNTFWGINGLAIYLSANQTKTRNTVVANNIFHNDGSKALCWLDNHTGVTLNNNHWVNRLPSTYDNCDGLNYQSGDVKLSTMPVYNNAHSFRLSNTSPAIDKGVSVGVTTDFFDIPRPQRLGIDIGAHEFSDNTNPTALPTPFPTSIPTTTPAPTSTPSPSIVPTATPSPLPTQTPISNINVSPQIETISFSTTKINKMSHLSVSGTDANVKDYLTMTISGLPKGLSVTSCSRSTSSGKAIIKCNIDGKAQVIGNFNIFVEILDNNGLKSQKNLSLIVK